MFKLIPIRTISVLVYSNVLFLYHIKSTNTVIHKSIAIDMICFYPLWTLNNACVDLVRMLRYWIIGEDWWVCVLEGEGGRSEGDISTGDIAIYRKWASERREYEFIDVNMPCEKNESVIC